MDGSGAKPSGALARNNRSLAGQSRTPLAADVHRWRSARELKEYALPTSTRFPYRKRGYFIWSPGSVTDRLKAAAIEFAQIAILIAGLIIAVLCASDLSGMLKW